MAVTKTRVKGKSLYKVRFTVPSERADGVARVSLAGEFNGWGAQDLEMKRDRGGSFSLSLVLPMGREYQYRYLLDGSLWINDESADGYRHCDFGNCDNSVLSL